MSETKWIDENNRVSELLLNGEGRIHFIGVLGVSMSALAAWCVSRGFSVSGSDDLISKRKIAQGVIENESSIDSDENNGVRLVDLCSGTGDPAVDLVIYSLAIPYNNKERMYARERGIPEISRAEMLGFVMKQYTKRIGISGTHGKSTTSALIYHILRECGKAPTAFVGAKINGDKSYFFDMGEYFVYEACEYRDAFLQFSPNYAIITSVEPDHTDYFDSVERLRDSFVRSTHPATRVYISTDVEDYRDIGARTGKDVAYYGSQCPNGYEYRIDSMTISGSRFALGLNNNEVGSFYLPIPGEYNVKNATAAIALLLDLGLEACQINRALSTFRGVPGRLEHIGDVGARRVYLDYAHHPTAVRETLRLLKSLCERVTVVFRPHTYTRTRDLAREFAKALVIADRVIITDIYPAREEPIPGVSAEWLASLTDGAVYIPMELVAERILSDTDGTVVLMGAGDLSLVKEMIFKACEE